MTTSRKMRSLARGFTVAAAAFGLLLQATRTSGAPASEGGQTAAAPAGTIAGNVESGKALFLTHQCWACHGYTGETGTRLIQDNGTFVARLFSVNSFINYFRAPRPNGAPPKR